jgi:hypothetical protein
MRMYKRTYKTLGHHKMPELGIMGKEEGDEAYIKSIEMILMWLNFKKSENLQRRTGRK